MGRIIVKLKLTNLSDITLKRAGARKDEPREVEVEALVDTGATQLCLKPTVIRALGLEQMDSVMSRTSNGPARRAIYEPVRLEVRGRHGNFDVVEVPEEVPNLLGQVPLEVLDYVVDSHGQNLVPNPAHGGEQMTEQYSER